MNEEVLHEYGMIRNEIDNKMALDNSLTTFAITTSVATLAFIFSQAMEVPYLFLLPFCILIPSTKRMANSRKTVAYLSAYLIVYCEPICSIKWETRHIKIDRNPSPFFPYNYECLILGIVCYVLFLYAQISSFSQNESLSLADNCYRWLSCTLPFLLVMREYQITLKIDRVDQERIKFIRIWNDIKEKGDIPYQNYLEKDSTKLAGNLKKREKHVK